MTEKITIKSGRLFNNGRFVIKGKDGYCFIKGKKFVYSKLFEHVKSKTNPSPDDLIIPEPKEKKKRVGYTSNHRKRPVIVSCRCGHESMEFESQTEAAKYIGVSRSFLTSVATGKKHTAMGYIVKYKNTEN